MNRSNGAWGGESISRAIDYMENHLQEECSMAEAAAASHYSLFHFVRMFNQVVHHTPYDYLIRRRLTEAAHLLVQGEDRIIDIARNFNFHSPEVFLRAFKRMFGMLPSEFRAPGGDIHPLLLSRRTPAHLENIQQLRACPPIPVERQSRNLAGRTISLPNGKDNVAALLTAVPALAFLQGTDANGEQSCLVLSSAERQGFLGTNPSSTVFSAPSWETCIIPAGLYLHVHHPGTPDSLYLTLDYIRQTWIPNAGYAAGVTNGMELFYLPLKGHALMEIEILLRKE